MPEDDSIDRESLTSNTVAKLREICKDRGLLVSGKKSVLVDRILEDAGIVDDPPEASEEASWEEEALVVDDDTPDTREKVDEVLSRIGDVVEAEVVEAEVVTPEPKKVKPPTIEPVILGEDDQPSLVISMPTLSSLGERWKAVVAVLLVTILVGASATIFLQRSSGFTVSELRFGESMDFQILESSVSINGEEMLSIVRDSSGGILDPACGEFSIEMDLSLIHI